MRRARADRRTMAAAAAEEEDAVSEEDLADPTPDLGELFSHYDALYFRGALAAAGFTIKWGSSSQSRSFGSCTFLKPNNTITLFEPVLKYHSCTDLKKALLHEMIHAIIYVKHNMKVCSHGPVFRAWMDAINSCSIEDPQRPVSGYNITTRHDFESERSSSFKGILWKCDSCGDTLPRATNQGPPSDACCIENVHDATCGNMLCYWHNHKSECSGSYEKMGLQTVTPVQKKVPKGTQLLLTYPSKASKSKGAIQESNSAELQENIKISKPNAEDEHLAQSSLMKVAKRHRSGDVQKAVVPAVDLPKEVKTEQALIAMEKHGLSPPVSCNDARSLGLGTSKSIGKKPKSEDAQIPNVTTERHKLFSQEVGSNRKSLESSSLQKTFKRRKKASTPPDEPLKEMNQKRALVLVVEPPKQEKTKQALIAMEKHGLFPPVSCNDAMSLGLGTSKNTGKKPKSEDVQIPSVPTERHKIFSLEGSSNRKSLENSCLQKTFKTRKKANTLPDEPHKEMNQKRVLVATEEHELFSPQGCNDATSPENCTSHMASKQHKPDSAQRPGSLSATFQGKPKLTQEFVTTEVHAPFSPEARNYAKSPGNNSSKQAGEQFKRTIDQTARSRHAYPLRRQKKDLVQPEKNELLHVMGCSNEKLMGKSSSKKARKHHEPEDIEETTVLPAVHGRNLKQSRFVASQKQQRKCRRQPAKEYAVMCPWMNIYESERSSGSTEPLVNKRTVRRKKERERIQSQATGGHSQTSAPCLDIVLADAPLAFIPPDPEFMIVISDDD